MHHSFLDTTPEADSAVILKEMEDALQVVSIKDKVGLRGWGTLLCSG